MKYSQSGLHKKLDSLRHAYLQKLPDKLKEAEQKWHHMNRSSAWEMDGFVELHRMIHTLAGSSAVFGLKSFSDTARGLERILKSVVEGTPCDRELLRMDITHRLDGLNRMSVSGPELEEALPEVAAPAAIHTEALPEEREKQLVFIIEDDPLQLENLALQVSHFGYNVRSFSELEAARSAMKGVRPDIVIMDVVFPEGNLAGIEAIQEMRRGLGDPLPVVFISRRNDFRARLQGVRAGGDAYFIKPVSITSLIENLDRLTMPQAPVPYRILIIDDDPELAAYYASILEQAGMSTLILNDPLQTLDPLIEFNPDLILTDMYMPGCTGQELAGVIRQMPAYVSIPIVFLSTETDVDKHLTAMRSGGDDFLTKPIKPDHLISSVALRAERMRIMRAFMERDGLTGLLNHTRTREQLTLAVEKCRRQGTGLVFAMIDIDRFKSVNDNYGHSTGDRVLNGLARLLQQRLRKTDIVGRYGGEEFAIVLLDTELDGAAKALDEIRASFSEIKHAHEEQRFSVTFSCGLAAFPDYPDSISLSNAADVALYKSKSEGRNRVSVARRP